MNNKLLTRKQYEEFLSKLPKDCCSFCECNKYQVILKEYENWVWIACLSPYWAYHTMLIPKRHFKYVWDMTEDEMLEYNKLIKVILDHYRKKELYRNDGTLIKKYVFFWRVRDDLFDPISGNNRPEHFHLHIAPDKDHLWDPVVDSEAYMWKVNEFVIDYK